MRFHKAKKVVIVIEAHMLKDVIEIATKFGADGYTAQSITGKGERGLRSGNDLGVDSDLLKNVKIEIVIDEEAAQKIAFEVIERFSKHYAVITYLEDVEVIRAKKFHVPE